MTTRHPDIGELPRIRPRRFDRDLFAARMEAAGYPNPNRLTVLLRRLLPAGINTECWKVLRKVRSPRVEWCAFMADLFGCSIDDFLSHEPPPPPTDDVA